MSCHKFYFEFVPNTALSLNDRYIPEESIQSP